jgi:FtsZ-binding cell division protein ZapB
MAEFGMGVGAPAQIAMDEIRLLRREIRALKERISQLEER